MLKRKISNKIEEYLKSDSKKMMIIDGARQIGKSFIIRHIGQDMFENFIEVNMEEDKLNDRLFADATSVEKFYIALSSFAGEKMKERENTLIFIDEIQAYPHLLTLVKFLMSDNRFRYIASGSLLGVTLRKTQSIPIGSIERVHMYPLDFEEFLWANNVGEIAIAEMLNCFEKDVSLTEGLHDRMMTLFRYYLIVGGLPEAVDTFVNEKNIVLVRNIHREIIDLYSNDAAKYENESSRKLKIQRIYKMIPSSLENTKKRIVVKDIDGVKGKRTSDYQNEFDYLVSSGIALEVDAISKPSFPLIQNAGKNLLKLYLNDVGLYTSLLYQNNIKPILDDVESINLGNVYENVVAQELKSHSHNLYYYDNKKIGEVDFLVDDYENLTAMPIEVKSGKDYHNHKALNKFMNVEEYNIKKSIVLSNERQICRKDNILYLPIYFVMFF